MSASVPHGSRVVFLSAYHDYRTAKRASIHQVADGLMEAGCDVSFISTRFSRLSKRTADSRMFLWDRANRIEVVNGIKCYLWRTELHPFQSERRWLNALTARVYPAYAALPNVKFDQMLSTADFVIIESSVAAIYLRRIKRVNPTAKIIYYATDRLDTVGAHPFIRYRLELDADLINHCSLRSPKMVSDFRWAEGRLFRAEFGINRTEFENVGPNPYIGSGLSAVSVGSMLFDPSFITSVARHFPDIHFHVIGCGTTFNAPQNVIIHPEMKFIDTLPYIKYASIGLAPYRQAEGVEYLAESSLKMAQYEYFGLPTVCPTFAVGDAKSRFGYQTDNAGSMVAAMSAARVAIGTIEKREFLSWREVGERILQPELFPGLALSN